MSILMRFDCDLSLDLHDPDMKRHEYFQLDSEFFYKHGLSKKQRERIQSENKKRQGQ